MTEEPWWSGFICSVCGGDFPTLESWDARHTDPDDPLAEVHEECCKQCKGAQQP